MEETTGTLQTQFVVSHRAASPGMDSPLTVEGLLARFDGISLSELARVSLLNRVDTK
jgi:hypothetical protein